MISFDELMACAEKNGMGEMVSALDAAPEEEWQQGFAVISGMATAVASGDFSALPQMMTMMG